MEAINKSSQNTILKVIILILSIFFFYCPKQGWATVKSSHPRIWLTDGLLTELRARAAANSSEWIELRNWCNSHIDDTGYDQGVANWNGYRGDGYSKYIINYALAYQILKESNPSLANTYAAKAIDIMEGVASGFALGEEPAYGLAAIRVGESQDRTVNSDEANALGITAATYKLGYSARFFGPAMAIGYDWLHGELTVAQRQRFYGVMYRWIDWYRGKRTAYNNGVVVSGIRYFEDKDGVDGPGENSNIQGTGYGYAYNVVEDNFFSGYAMMVALSAYAVYGDSPDDDTYLGLWQDLWSNTMKPALTDSTRLKGGDSHEGWNYGSGYWRWMQALDGVRTASDEAVFQNLDFPKEFFLAYLHATKPNLYDLYDHGDWPGAYKGRPYRYIVLHLVHLLRELYPSDNIAKVGQYYLNHVDFASATELWEEMLWYNPSASEQDFSNEPLFYRSIGTGLVTMRSSWEDNSDTIWASIQLDNELKVSHEDYDEGHFTIQRGDDYLITDGASEDVFGHNTISFGGQNQLPGLGGEIAIQGFENTTDHLYVWADVAKAYQWLGYATRATKFVRKFAYLKPNIFVIFDETTSGSGYESKQWMINFKAEPTLSQEDNLMTSTVGNSKVFVKTLIPLNYTIDKKYYDDWKGKAWRVDLKPTEIKLDDTFMHVIYVASADISSIPSTVRIDATSGNMVGAHIKDGTKNRVTMFNRVEGIVSTPVAYTIEPTADCYNLLFDMKVSTNYDISIIKGGSYTITVTEKKNGSYTSSDQGVLSFTLEIENTPPYTSGHSPAKGATGVAVDTNIIVHIKDDGAGVYEDSVVIRVDGVKVYDGKKGNKTSQTTSWGVCTRTGSSADYTYTYDPSNNFAYNQVINVTVDAQDLAATPNVMAQDAYSFTTTIGTDTDADGMPDYWENAHGVDNPNDDPDEDGLTNLQEYLGGSDPNSPIANQAGWPKTVLGYVSSPCLGDIDADGDFEVVVGYRVVGPKKTYVYAWHHNGAGVSGWSNKEVEGAVTSAPAIGDIDGDKDIEIVIGDEDSYVHAWHHDGTAVNGWPTDELYDAISSTPVISDIDGDGDVEIIVGTEDKNVSGIAYLYVLDKFGNIELQLETKGKMKSTPALGDIDGDGDIEIVVGCDDGEVYAWHSDGSAVDGFPVATGDSVSSSPALGDIDNDGDVEIVVGSEDNSVYIWNNDGSPYGAPWPIATGGKVTSSPALGDIDGDGYLEIVVGSEDWKIYAWRYDGTPIFEYDAGDDIEFSSPVLGDIDGDGDIEIIVGSNSNKVYAWHHNGNLVEGFPITTLDDVQSSPMLGDLDRDGDIEIIVGSNDNKVYVWDLPGKFDSRNIEWGMFHLNARHTGFYQRKKGPVSSTIIPVHYGYIDSDGGMVFVEDATSNIFGTELVIPSNALTSNTKIEVGEAKDTPLFPSDVTAVGTPMNLTSIDFNVPVIIRIPYTQSMLDDAGVSTPDNLRIYAYNTSISSWNETSGGSVVDKENKVVWTTVGHFSLFGLGWLIPTGDGGNGDGGNGDGGNGDGGNGDGCVIATLIYGSAEAREEQILHKFRDRYLLTNRLGKRFMEFYYKIGPPIAKYIEKREKAKKILRVMLKPIIWFARQLTK